LLIRPPEINLLLAIGTVRHVFDYLTVSYV